MSINVLLVDDHQMMRDGLRLFIQRDPELNLVGEAADGRSAVALTDQLRPDLIIMDIDLPDIGGIEVCRRLKEGSFQPKILILSGYCDEQFISDAMGIGASGYLLKANAASELLRAIRIVMTGQIYLSPEVSTHLVTAYQKRAKPLPKGESKLSPREREVLRLIAEGRNTKEIALDLGVSSKTIETHRQHVMAKLGLSTVADLTKYALREGLTSL